MSTLGTMSPETEEHIKMGLTSGGLVTLGYITILLYVIWLLRLA